MEKSGGVKCKTIERDVGRRGWWEGEEGDVGKSGAGG